MGLGQHDMTMPYPDQPPGPNVPVTPAAPEPVRPRHRPRAPGPPLLPPPS